MEITPFGRTEGVGYRERPSHDFFFWEGGGKCIYAPPGKVSLGSVGLDPTDQYPLKPTTFISADWILIRWWLHFLLPNDV
jgi:hypothetical protein